MKLQSVGTEITLGTRLISTSLFDNEEGRATLLETITNVLSFTTPYIVLGTPFLYNHTAGATSVTPAWYDSLWHVRSSWSLWKRAFDADGDVIGSCPSMETGCGTATRTISRASTRLYRSIYRPSETSHPTAVHISCVHSPPPCMIAAESSLPAQNEGDVYEPNHTESYWGPANYEKLLSVKQK